MLSSVPSTETGHMRNCPPPVLTEEVERGRERSREVERERGVEREVEREGGREGGSGKHKPMRFRLVEQKKHSLSLFNNKNKNKNKNSTLDGRLT